MPLEYIIADLEATCWEEGADVSSMEIIEIGAVRMDGDSYKIGDEFSLFVRPRKNPALSAFCKSLTGIRQEDVDGAEDFPAALEKFAAWAGGGELKFCSWSVYDLKQIEVECARHGLPVPDWIRRHIDLRQLYAAMAESAPCPMEKALSELGLKLAGRHHRALDDSRNIARIAVEIFSHKAWGGVEIDEYDFAWPGEFEREKAALLAALCGPARACARIEHVGSTALPGCAAKPTIDLMIGVEKLDVGGKEVAALEALGYRYFGEFAIPGRHFFRKGRPPTHHVHWVEAGGDFWVKQLSFRDYMREHPRELAAYVELKKNLAEKYKDDRDKYTAAKTEFIEAVNKKAAAWRGAGG